MYQISLGLNAGTRCYFSFIYIACLSVHYVGVRFIVDSGIAKGGPGQARPTP